jgi:MFS family permease
MIALEEQPALRPSLGPALLAMTLLQAIIALAVFAPGVVAPRTGLGPEAVGAFVAAVFAVGMLSSWRAGSLVARWGPMRLGAACCLAVALGMAACAGPGLAALLCGGVLVGLAFGPDTPASASLLGPLTPPSRRPLVFSVRQTGNQIGAIAGSLTLPALATVADPRWCYALVAAVATAVLLLFTTLAPRYAVPTRAAPGLTVRTAWTLLTAEPLLMRLAIAAMAFGALQLGLNAFFVTLAVREWGIPHVTAGVVLAIAQFGGLLGRLGWGWAASKLWAPRAVLTGLGFGMAALALTLASFGARLPLPALAALAALLGLTASGWNGVFVAEVARLAPKGLIAETTGAAMTAAYAGLLAGPFLVAGVAQVASLATAFAVLGVLCLAAAVSILGVRE